MCCKNVYHQYFATNQNTKPHILSQNCAKIGVDQCLSFFICHSFFYYAAVFPLKGRLKIYYHPLPVRDKSWYHIVLSIQLLDIAPIVPNCSLCRLTLLVIIGLTALNHWSKWIQYTRYQKTSPEFSISWNFGIFLVFNQICKQLVHLP